MWRTASNYTKSGGKLVNIRATGPFDATANYGVTVSEITPIADGIKFKVRFAVDPPFKFEGTCLNEVRNLSNDINHRHGFGDLTVLDPKDTETVRNDEAYWGEFLKGSYFKVTMAVKL